MANRRPFRTAALVTAAALALLALPGLASAGATEEPIDVELVTLTKPGASGGGCHASTFAVVADAPDVAEYRVTWTSTTAPGREYTQVFNRHERGNLQFSKFPTWRPDNGKVAGLLVANSLDGPGDDCAVILARHKESYAVARATVLRYTQDVPAATAVAYEVRSRPAPPRNDGPTAEDACTLAHFVTFPQVAGAKRYRITIIDSLTGVRRTSTTVVEAEKANPAPPASSGIRPYKRAGRIGHLMITLTKPNWGCRYQEWQVSERVEKVTVKAEKT